LTVITARALRVSPWMFVRSLLGVFASAAVMSGIVLIARLAMIDAGVPAALRLVACSLLGAAVFFSLCLWRVPEISRDLRSLLAGRRAGRVGAPATVKP
jgi:hypothetical protein